ncbi:MAG: glycosyltransferase family 2 protein [Phycisphaerales bacterium]|nr:MAG: glycosyltransferase family 2 protein [Phycisphaerales bacterium]
MTESITVDISVVVTLYNKEKEISRALQSVCNQIVPPKEVIVVDDGSTDHSAEIVEGTRMPGLRLVRQGNTGVYGSRNRGIVEARYELIAFLDGDDTWEPRFLEAITTMCCRYPNCGVYGTAWQTRTPCGDTVVPRFRGVPPRGKDGILKDYFLAASKGAVLSSSSIAVPKRIFENIGMFLIDAGRGGDKEMWLRIAADHQVAFRNEVLATWHLDASNRVSHIRDYRPEPPAVVTGRSILYRDDLPGEIRDGLSIYIKMQEVFHSTGLILAGRRIEGRRILLRCGMPSSCRVKWIAYVCASCLPWRTARWIYDLSSFARVHLRRLISKLRWTTSSLGSTDSGDFGSLR